MPTGPQGQRRPADVVGGAVKVARLSVGEEAEELETPTGKIRSGHAGSAARTERLTKERRAEIASVAAQARWR